MIIFRCASVAHRAMFVAALSLASTLALASPSQNDDAARIASVHADWVAAINAGHYESPAAMGMWAPDLKGWAPAAPEDSFEREAAGLKQYAEKYPRSAHARPTFTYEIVEIEVAGDLAFAHVLWTSKTEEGVTQPTMRSFEIWRRQGDGTWRMTRYLESPKS